MIKCVVCKSKMPDELFVPSFPIMVGGDCCPICTMTLINAYHGIPLDTLPTGEMAKQMVEDAWEYYRPKGNPYKKFLNG